MHFYNYLIYRLYSWRLSKKDDTPGASVILILCLTHYGQILALYSMALYLLPRNLNITFKAWQIFIFGVGFQAALYFFVYNKQKWNQLIEFYSKESPEQRRKRTRFVLIYVFGSAFLHIITLPFLFLM